MDSQAKVCKDDEPEPNKDNTTQTSKSRSKEPISQKLKDVHQDSSISNYFSKVTNFFRCSSVQSAEEGTPKDPGFKETGKDRFINQNADRRKDRVYKNIIKPMVPQPDRYTSNKRQLIENLKPRPVRKATNIVAATIDYGLSNGILLRNGKYFWMKDECQPGKTNSAASGSAEKHISLPRDTSYKKSRITDKQPKKRVYKNRRKTRKRKRSSSTSDDSESDVKCNCKLCKKEWDDTK